MFCWCVTGSKSRRVMEQLWGLWEGALGESQLLGISEELDLIFTLQISDDPEPMAVRGLVRHLSHSGSMYPWGGKTNKAENSQIEIRVSTLGSLGWHKPLIALMKSSDGTICVGLWWWLYTPTSVKIKAAKDDTGPASLSSDYVKLVRVHFQIPSFSLVFVSSFKAMDRNGWTSKYRPCPDKAPLVKILLGHEQQVNHLGPIACTYLAILVWLCLCASKCYRIIVVEF